MWYIYWFVDILLDRRFNSPSLRNYIVDTIANAQDGWKVETRVRLSGNQKGNKYKCFKSPSGICYWSLKKAKENGFTGFLSPVGGTPRRSISKKKSFKKKKSKRNKCASN